MISKGITMVTGYVMKLGIIGAMESEVAELKSVMEETNVVDRAGMLFYDGVINHREVVVVKCGLGKVNAAFCTQVMIDLFRVDMIINTGVAGSLDPKINIGDIVLSTDVVQHDFDLTPLGLKKGTIPPKKSVSFTPDDGLRTIARVVCHAVNRDISVFEGRIATGDSFICNKKEKHRIRSEFGALCCEMEGGAIAQVCDANDVPFLIIRAISDKADDSASEDFPSFEKKAIKHTINLELEMLRRFQI